MTMTLSDFEFGGYVTLSTFLRIEVLEHAEALDDFLQEHDLVQESFRVAGPGLYYILVDKGWDRGGDSHAIIIKKVPDGVPTVIEYLRGLALARDHFERLAEPFHLMREVGSRRSYATLTDEQRDIIHRADHDAYREARAALLGYLEN